MTSGSLPKLGLLGQAFNEPNALNPKWQRERITEEASAKIGEIALRLRDRDYDSEDVAHFVMQLSVLPDKALVVIASDLDYDFGVLQSTIHVSWALAVGTALEDRPRYTPSTCFETFPFPRSGHEPRCEVEKWAKYLDDVRNDLLGSHEKLTMTKLYNEVDALRQKCDSSERAYPLLVAHEKLDEAVAAAYGWEWPLEEEEILGRLLALNLERYAAEQKRLTNPLA